MTFEELYRSLLEQELGGKPMPKAESEHLRALLDPKKTAPVWVTTDCSSCESGESDCCAACLFHAIERQADGRISIDPDKCVGCASCLRACSSGTLTASRDILPALHDIKQAKGPVYALVAPSFHGQFSENVTPGKLRSAFLALGFTEMTEVALFADLLTLKEALSFDRHVSSKEDFQLTSCCCPVWISLLKGSGQELLSHVPGAVSPMIAAGRTIKTLHPDALTIFIGPCLAKKAEARDEELRGAIDWVLTFREIQDVFEAADIHPEELEDAERGHASRAGRLYGRAGGVSEAVYETLLQMDRQKGKSLNIRRADGVQNCKAMLDRLFEGGERANYFEGMGCVGGCVGGPRSITDREQGRENVDRYGSKAEARTPLENPYVDALLQKLGFSTVEDFLERSSLYNRSFFPVKADSAAEEK